MSNKEITFSALAIAIVGAAVKLGGFTNESAAWAMLFVAAIIFIYGTWSFWERIRFCLPFRVLPPRGSRAENIKALRNSEEFNRVHHFYEELEQAAQDIEAALSPEGFEQLHFSETHRAEIMKAYDRARWEFWHAVVDLSVLFKYLIELPNNR